jgi:hypothetical protein
LREAGVRSSLLQEVEGPGAYNGLCAALYAEFTAEVIDVPLDGVHAHDEATGDLTVGSTFKQ